MAKFCKYCGKQIEEGIICDCKESLENAARVVNKVESTLEITKEVNDNSKKLITTFKDYLKNPKAVTKKVINENDNVFIIATGVIFILSVIFNLFTILSKCVKDINKIINLSSKITGLDIFQLREFNLIANNGQIFLYSLIFGVALLAVSISILFITSKIKKSQWSNQAIVYATIINTIPITISLLIGGLLQLLFSYKLLILLQLLYLLIFVIAGTLSYNIVTNGFSKLTDVIIYSIVVFIGILIISFIVKTIIFQIAGTYEIHGQTVSFYIDAFKNNITNLTGEFGKEAFEEIISDIIYEIVY